MMEDPLQAVLILLLGWLLGTISPAIVDAIKSKREAALVRAAISNELKEFSAILLAACFRTKSSSGQVDRAYLSWQKGKLEKDVGSEKSARFLGLTDRLLAFPDDQIVAASQALATTESKATLLQKYAVPLLDYRVSALQTFDTTFQAKLLEIRRNISLLDSIVDQSREFYRMTFMQLPDGNHEIIRANLDQTYSEYADRAKIIIDQIHALRPEV
jgi:hypothetical protein